MRSALALIFILLTTGCTANKTILVRSDPPGARVIVDNCNEGNTPTQIDLPLPPLMPGQAGVKHIITIEKNGYERRQRILQDFGDMKVWSSFPDEIFVELTPLDNQEEALISSREIILPARTFPLRNIAVAGLEPLAVKDAEARTLGEGLRAAIVDSGYFNVVSRADMKRILEEQQFQRTDVASLPTLVEMGKILGAEKIVGGSVGRVGDTFSLSVRMVDVETAKVDVFLTQNVKGREDALLDVIGAVGRRVCLKYAESRNKP